MINVRISSQDNGQLTQITNRANRLNGGVRVGYFASQGNHNGKRPIMLGNLARLHEFGTRKIPKRAFIKPAITQNRQNYANLVQSQIGRVLQGQMTVQSLWQLLGTRAVADIQQYMRNATFTPLNPATIKRKGSSKPLIDTGQLRQSVTYQVK